MAKAKYNEDGLRMCNSADCPNQAVFMTVWTDGPLAVCKDCANKLVGIGNAMGFHAPQAAMRPLSVYEMFKPEPRYRLRETVSADGRQMLIDEHGFCEADFEVVGDE